VSGGSAGQGGAGGGDQCPDDPNKTAPGKCGCGAADEDSVMGAGCGPLQESILHRYSFENDVKDLVGTAHGTLMAGASIANGALVLSGGQNGQYLDLPNGLISTLTNATLEAWVTWTGTAGGDWQRIFDFGSSTVAEGQAGGTGSKYPSSARARFALATPARPRLAKSSSTRPPSYLRRVRRTSRWWSTRPHTH
jgi:hypothetical protein